MLERLRVIREIDALIGEMRENQFDHEGFEPETFLLPLHFCGPELDEPRDLREVHLVRLLARADEFEVAGNTGLEERSVILADEIAIPVAIAVVEYRHAIDVEARS